MYIYVYICIKCAYKQINEMHIYLYVYMHMHMYAYAYVHVDIYMYLFHTCVYMYARLRVLRILRRSTKTRRKTRWFDDFAGQIAHGSRGTGGGWLQHTLQHTATRVLHHSTAQWISLDKLHMDREELAEVECNTHCNIMQHYETRGLKHTATHCNTLQHTATHWMSLAKFHMVRQIRESRAVL